MLAKKLIENFLMKGQKVDTFKGAKVMIFKHDGQIYSVVRGRGPKGEAVPNLPVKNLVIACDAWDPAYRVRGYGWHRIGENAREIIVTL